MKSKNPKMVFHRQTIVEPAHICADTIEMFATIKPYVTYILHTTNALKHCINHVIQTFLRPRIKNSKIKIRNEILLLNNTMLHCD